MSYLGRDVDKISNIEKLDNITFDGSSSYTLQKSSTNFVPSSANAILISIDGVVQSGNFTVSGSTIDFGTAVAGTSTCNFILHLGVGLITAPSDGSITKTKLADQVDIFAGTSLNAADLGTGLHIKTGDSGVSSLSVSHDELVVESDGNAGISIIGGGSNTVGVAFGDSADPDNGRINYVHSDTSLRLINNASENVRIHSNGVMAANAGIALGVGTANTSSNVLDDYEEGTWTPAASVSSSDVSGSYVKVGNIVIAKFKISIGASGSNVNITGFPFTTASDGEQQGLAREVETGGDLYFIRMAASNTTGTLIRYDANASVGTSESFQGQITYIST